jgi:hypothetical protein
MPYLTAELVDRPTQRPRRGNRRAVAAEAQCRRGSMREAVELRDLSPGGARVRALSPLRVGHSIWLKLPGIEAQEARIVWTRGCESGCEFVRPLHPAVFETVCPAG